MAASQLVRRPALELIGLTRHLASCLTLQPARGFAASRGDGRAASQDPPDASQAGVDTRHRSATEMMWPASKHQERFAARMHTALNSVLVSNANLRERLVRQLGFAIQDIRMSPDNLKAYIQWDSCLGHHTILEQELQYQLPKLKNAVAHSLRARNMPQLVFRHDALTHKQREVEDMLRQLEQEDDEVEEEDKEEEESTDEEEEEEEEEEQEEEEGQETPQEGEEALRSAAAVSGRCRGMTKAGKRCRKVAPDGNYCHQHEGVEQEVGGQAAKQAAPSGRCRGTTKAGKRCKKEAHDGYFCHLHS